ncbi:hypothetical protein EDC01DRAFT_745352 [Geopyxis carbonaria]|nr:hypothetical protein EDC01DRAFT_745352 [Geopyxis carbonaria]
MRSLSLLLVAATASAVSASDCWPNPFKSSCLRPVALSFRPPPGVEKAPAAFPQQLEAAFPEMDVAVPEGDEFAAVGNMNFVLQPGQSPIATPSGDITAFIRNPVASATDAPVEVTETPIFVRPTAVAPVPVETPIVVRPEPIIAPEPIIVGAPAPVETIGEGALVVFDIELTIIDSSADAVEPLAIMHYRVDAAGNRMDEVKMEKRAVVEAAPVSAAGLNGTSYSVPNGGGSTVVSYSGTPGSSSSSETTTYSSSGDAMGAAGVGSAAQLPSFEGAAVKVTPVKAALTAAGVAAAMCLLG